MVKNWYQLVLLIVSHPDKLSRLSPIMFGNKRHKTYSVKSLWVETLSYVILAIQRKHFPSNTLTLINQRSKIAVF